MKRLATIFSLIFLTFISVKAETTEASGNTENSENVASQTRRRPRIGLALGGGGAKGMAHVGVLKVLKEVGIPIDYIAGTSIGSIMGGLTAIGYTPEQLDSIVRVLDWGVYMGEKLPHRDLSYREKESRSTYIISIPFGAGTQTGKKMQEVGTTMHEGVDVFKRSLMNSLPAGVKNGNNILNLLNNLAVGYQDSLNFMTDLPIPFSCVSTNLLTGKPEVMSNGKLPYAIRASMAIPGVFPPVKKPGKVLMDGGMRNNFPVDVCKQMGADIVIGVSIGDELKSNEESVNSLPQLLGQILTMITSNNVDENIELCDVYIRPDITGYNSLSFDPVSVDTLIRRGYRAADTQRENLMKLRALLDQFPEEKGSGLPAAKCVLGKDITIESVSLSGVDPRDSEWLYEHGGLEMGESCKGDKLEDFSEYVRGTGAFKTVTYTTTAVGNPDDERYAVHYDVTPSPAHTFDLALRVDSEESIKAIAALRFNEKKLHGIKYGLVATLGFNPDINVYFNYAPRKFARICADYSFHASIYKTWLNNVRTPYNESLRNRVRIYLSEYNAKNCHFEAGADYENHRSNIYYNYIVASHDKPDSTICDYAGVFANFNVDTRDKEVLATRGFYMKFSTKWKYTDFGYKKVHSGERFNGFGETSLSIGGDIPTIHDKFVISPQFYGRILYGETANAIYDNIAGGEMAGRYLEHQLPFIGITETELLKNIAMVLRCDFRYNIYGNHYATLLFNWMTTGDFQDGFFTDDNLDKSKYGVALRYTYATGFGPLSLDIHWSNLDRINIFTQKESRVGVYLNLGYYF